MKIVARLIEIYIIDGVYERKCKFQSIERKEKPVILRGMRINNEEKKPP